MQPRRPTRIKERTDEPSTKNECSSKKQPPTFASNDAAPKENAAASNQNKSQNGELSRPTSPLVGFYTKVIGL